jgi:AraC-like DNA-binding protein
VILQHGIAALPSALFHYQGRLGLSAQQVWFISYVLSHKWDEDLPYPSLKKMARVTRMSLSQLQRIKNSLCQMGYLKVYPRFNEARGQQTNAYDFSALFDRLEALIMADPPPSNAIRAEGDPPDVAELAELDPSFVARYGRVITRHGVAAVPRAVFTHQAALGLTPQQVWFISYIFSFRWDTSLPYPSLRKMSAVTGYSSVQLHTIKASLVNMGYLQLIRRKDEHGGQDSNAYDFSGLLDAIKTLLQPEPHRVHPTPLAHQNGGEADEVGAQGEPGGAPLPRRRGRRVRAVAASPPAQAGQVGRAGRTGAPRPGSARLSGGDSAHLTRGVRAHFTDGDSVQFTEGGSTYLPAGGSEQLSGGDSAYLTGGDSMQLSFLVNQTDEGGRARTYQRGIARGLHKEEALHPETDHEDDSNRLSLDIDAAEDDMDDSRPTYSPYIAAVITDFSSELNDPTHIISNVTQALKLWRQSRLDEQTFTELMYEAKRRTRLGQGMQGSGGMSNKMAYFFAVLRSLVREAGER